MTEDYDWGEREDFEETCVRCDQPLSAASVPELAHEDICGDCIELQADHCYESYKDSLYED